MFFWNPKAFSGMLVNMLDYSYEKMTLRPIGLKIIEKVVKKAHLLFADAFLYYFFFQKLFRATV